MRLLSPEMMSVFESIIIYYVSDGTVGYLGLLLPLPPGCLSPVPYSIPRQSQHRGSDHLCAPPGPTLQSPLTAWVEGALASKLDHYLRRVI